MDILFKTSKIRKIGNSIKAAQRELGANGGRLLLQRLDEIRDSETLADLMKLPGPGCHPLKGNRKGQWALDLEHPKRLIVEPANEPILQLEDGGLDVKAVTILRVLEIKDYHG